MCIDSQLVFLLWHSAAFVSVKASVARRNLFVREAGPSLERIVDDSHVVSARYEHDGADDHERNQPIGISVAVEVAQ